MAKTSGRTSSRINLRQIAENAGVSVMTVSYALRDIPEVSAGERRRIHAIAEKMGYRPDPLLTHLMAHLRAHRTPKPTVNLALLTMLNAGFVQRLIAGASQRADKLGYALDRVDLHTTLKNPKLLTRTLVARGVAGVILAPLDDPSTYRELLDWGQFAAVAMTYSITGLPVNRVVTHHYDNAVRTFDLLIKRGFKRIGLAMTPDMEFRANHSYSGAYSRLLPMEKHPILPILILDQTIKTTVPRWFRKHQPDALVLANSNHYRQSILPNLSYTQASNTAFVSLDHEQEHKIAGIDQQFETIGARAVDELVAQILRNERGLPDKPTVTMIEGRWTEPHGLYPLSA